ncbi:hypothetical protein HG536_0G02490 [Torulaspora globosa]|uniref:Mtf2-like C-terminal domain-containing protein n=1 Tax=Torulaspora globosa TaxID=48254 RepID=A0A7G3ZLK2_9SACH|nr:uncharacterized protein HG536_0G02490 [Torulaspora globosa]QLL34388.1 hypothetical protein HG536_0G02490 [Torulaspora globosa]
MLRSKAVGHLRVLGRQSYSLKLTDQKSHIPSRSSDLNTHFKDEEELSSVQERALFGAVFNKLMMREELRSKNSEEVLSQAAAIQPDVTTAHKEEGRGLQVVFEKKSQEIRPEDRKLFDFFKNTSGSTQLGDIGESAKLTTDDIRNYPVSLISSMFSDAEDVKVPESEKASRELANAEKAPISEDEFGLKADFKLRMNKEVLETLKAKESFKAAMQTAMEPYLTSIFSQIETDYDLFVLVRKLLKSYVDRDKTLDNNNYKSSSEIVQHIKEQCLKNSKELPRPLGVSLPYTLVELFTSEELNFPSERKFSLISYIYQECKKDISLYLNVCNVDFYNLLLRLSWDNYREIYQLKQLTTEMSINGIRGDLYTIEILDKIAHDLRHINDGILNEDTGSMQGNPLTVGVVWCRENSTDLQLVENYLRKLKENLA